MFSSTRATLTELRKPAGVLFRCRQCLMIITPYSLAPTHRRDSDQGQRKIILHDRRFISSVILARD
jgi:hypothetical protein